MVPQLVWTPPTKMSSPTTAPPTCPTPSNGVGAAAGLFAEFIADLHGALEELVEDLHALGFDVADLCPEEVSSTSPPEKSRIA